MNNYLFINIYQYFKSVAYTLAGIAGRMLAFYGSYITKKQSI